MSGDLEPSPGDVLHRRGQVRRHRSHHLFDGEFDMAGVARFVGLRQRRPRCARYRSPWTCGASRSLIRLVPLLRSGDVATEAHVPLRVIKPSPAVRRLVEYAGVGELLPDE
jgi:hypothetical protein